MVCLFLPAAVLRPDPSKAAEEEGGKTNVLFIICDDLNADLGSYGNPQVQSPNIDKLASRGMLFENAYCQYPLCGPSRASFMTGLYPNQNLITKNRIYIRNRLPDVQTLSQMFINNGYQATRVGKIYHYDVPKAVGTDGHDDPASWMHTFNPKGRDVAEEDKIFTLREGRYGATLSWLAAEGDDNEQTDGIGAAETVKLLKQYADEETPFFLAVGLYRPHTPYVAPKKYFELYPLENIQVPAVPDGYLKTLPPDAVRSVTRMKEQLNLSDELSRQAIRAYYASISFADAQIGRMLDALTETGLDKNTVVVFTSDHGYHMGEHGWWQKTTLFENADRVPLIIAAPGMKEAGGRTRSIAEMVDFYPTLAELCGLEAPAYLSGVSLVPTLEDPETASRRDAFTQYANGYGLRTARYRYTEWGTKGEKGAELYDHQRDPEELHNLIQSADPELLKQLSARLHERIEESMKVPLGITRITP